MSAESSESTQALNASPTTSPEEQHQTQSPTELPSSVGESIPSVLPKDASVYVSELDQSVNEADLFPIFSSYGNILSIRVVKDPATRRSLGYAYVNFKSSENATAALDHDFNYINNKPCRVSPFQKDPSLRHSSPKSTVFIRNLDADVTVDELKKAFESYGNIVAAKIATPLVSNRIDTAPSSKDTQDSSKSEETPASSEESSETSAQSIHTFGYVEFETSEEADAAIQSTNGTAIGKRTIYVGHHISKRSGAERNGLVKIQLASAAEAEATFTNIFVKNVDTFVTEEEFEQLFSKHGEIVTYSLPKDDDGNSRGYGFVNYKEHSEAVEAVKALNDLEFKGKTLIVTRAMKKYERDEELRQQYEASRLKRLDKYAGTNLYIKYLDHSIDDDKLREIFAPFGTITSARVMTDDNGRSRGFGFVCYSTATEAQKAINEMHNAEIDGKNLYVTIAQRRENKPHLIPQFTYFNSPIPGVVPPEAGNSPTGSNNASGPNNNNNGNHGHGHSSHPNGRNGRVPPYGNPLFNPYYHLAAGVPQNYGAGQPWGPLPQMGGAHNGPPGGPPPVMFAPGPPYPYAGMMHIPPNMNFRKNGPNNSNGRTGSANSNGHGNKIQGGPQQQGQPRGANRKHNGNNGFNSNNGGNPSNTRHHHGNNNSNNNNHRQPYHNPNGFNSRNPAPSSSATSGANYYSSSTLSAAIASAANPAAERQVIGEALYPKVQRHPAVRNSGELTAKLTGMMLDISTQELLNWIDDDAVLNSRIQEAYDQYMEFLSNKDEENTDA